MRNFSLWCGGKKRKKERKSPLARGRNPFTISLSDESGCCGGRERCAASIVVDILLVNARSLVSNPQKRKRSPMKSRPFVTVILGEADVAFELVIFFSY